MDLDLQGRVAIVTGGSQGIGKAIALQLAREGAGVAIAARGTQLLEAAAAEIQSHSDAQVYAVTADTTKDGDVQAMVSAVMRTFNRIDILINCAANAGGQASRPLGEIMMGSVLADIDVKVLGYLRCAQSVVPHMKAQGWGRIVNIAGLGARQASSTVRSIRTAAVVALTKNLANELGADGINVTAIHPGRVRTESAIAALSTSAQAAGKSVGEIEAKLTRDCALRRMIEPDEIGYVAAFLASPRSVAVNGSVVVADGSSGNAIFY